MKNIIGFTAVIFSLSTSHAFAFTCPSNDVFMQSLQSTAVDQKITMSVPYGDGTLSSVDPVSQEEKIEAEAYGPYQFTWASIQLILVTVEDA